MPEFKVGDRVMIDPNNRTAQGWGGTTTNLLGLPGVITAAEPGEFVRIDYGYNVPCWGMSICTTDPGTVIFAEPSQTDLLFT